jgi:hypothetical protein
VKAACSTVTSACCLMSGKHWSMGMSAMFGAEGECLQVRPYKCMNAHLLCYVCSCTCACMCMCEYVCCVPERVCVSVCKCVQVCASVCVCVQVCAGVMICKWPVFRTGSPDPDQQRVRSKE